jgi:hypothetical protein|tara:strand:+ start:54 stop:356 length:303 start_codon:yes stop_codon:yes gene_type:complete
MEDWGSEDCFLLVLFLLIVKIKTMKTKNNLLKGIIIGIGVIIVPLILMGTTNTNTGDEVGRYQISTTTMGTGENYIFETIIDTKTGNITSRKKNRWTNYY